MEDLALIVSLMLFVPIVVGLVAITLAIVNRFTGKLRMTATVFTGLVGLLAGWGLFTYPLIGAVPLALMVTALLFLYIPKR